MFASAHAPMPSTCTICLEDNKSQFLQWHKSHHKDQRLHSACIDCVSTICFKTLHNPSLHERTLSCPECREELSITSKRFVREDILIMSYKLGFLFALYKLMIEPIGSAVSQIILHGPLLWHRKSFCNSFLGDTTSGHSKLINIQLTHLEMTSAMSVLCISALAVIALKQMTLHKIPRSSKLHEGGMIALQLGFYFLTNRLSIQKDRMFFLNADQNTLLSFCYYPENSKWLMQNQIHGLIAGIAIPILMNFLRLNSESQIILDSQESVQKALLNHEIKIVNLKD